MLQIKLKKESKYCQAFKIQKDQQLNQRL